MFQTNKPMVPFMFDQLSAILYRLLSLVYIRSKVENRRKLKELMSKEFLELAENQMNEGGVRYDGIRYLPIFWAVIR